MAKASWLVLASHRVARGMAFLCSFFFGGARVLLGEGPGHDTMASSDGPWLHHHDSRLTGQRVKAALSGPFSRRCWNFFHFYIF